MPQLSRIAVLSNPANPNHPQHLRNANAAAQALKVRLQILEVRTPSDIAPAFATATRESANALLVLGDPMFTGEIRRIVTLATQSRLPLVGTQREYAGGALLTYGIDQRDSFQRAAAFVDRILKGASPRDLPVEQPTKFELVINLKTAKALGLTIPRAVLARADEVIQ
jgi:putative ABC transport system substrate-binding protein